MKGRKPVPSKIHQLKGTFRVDRHTLSMSAVDKNMTPPDYLTARGKELFATLYQNIKHLGYSNQAHAEMLGLAALSMEEVEILSKVLEGCTLSYELTNNNGEVVYKARPEVKLRADAIRRSQSLLAEFGLSASSEGKVTIKQADSNPQSQFAAYGS